MTGNSQLAPSGGYHHTTPQHANLTIKCWLITVLHVFMGNSRKVTTYTQTVTAKLAGITVTFKHEWIGDRWGRHKESRRLAQMIHDSCIHSGRVNGSTCAFRAAERPVGEGQLQASLGWNRRFKALENVCNLFHSCLSFAEQRSDNTAVTEHVFIRGIMEGMLCRSEDIFMNCFLIIWKSFA